MSVLNHLKPEDDTGKVAEAYSIFPKGVPVPAPLLLMNASAILPKPKVTFDRFYLRFK